MKLNGNTILITGGSSGIGLALAKKFVELGNKVLITGRSLEKLNQAQEECPELIGFKCDSSNESEMSELSQKIQSEYKGLNVLINNAGVLVSRNLQNTPESLVELNKEVDINVKGTVLTTSLFLNQITQNKGSIINVSSGLAFVPMMSAPIYCGTKAFIHSFTTSLRFQLEDCGVKVFELAPPAVKTNMTARLPEDGFFDILSTEELVETTMSGLRNDKLEIRPGQANKLKWLSRIAPSFIERKLAKASRGYMPQTQSQ